MAVRDPDEGNAFVNSEKSREKPKQKKDIQVFEGVGTVRKREKTGFAKWFSEMFLSGRTWKEIALDILNNQLVPEGKDMFRNGIVSMLDARIYRDSKPGSYASSVQQPNGSFITRYIDYSKISSSAPTKNSSTQAALAANQEKDKEIIKNGFELPSFPNRQSAIDFLNSMKAEISRYDTLSVYDVAWKRGKKVDYTFEAYGWEKDEILAIKEPTRFRTPIVVDYKGQQVKMTHYIDLPPCHPIS